MVGKYKLKEGYNLDAATLIRPRLNGTRLAVVGGFRSLHKMEEVLEKGHADLISMSRPFIREPHLLKKFRNGDQDRAACRSCNKCLASVANEIPVRCFNELSS